MNGTPVPDMGDFDPNSYFKKLTHITIKEGYVLDYVYFSDELGGLPLVYARKVDDKPFQSYEEFLKSYDEEFSGERSYSGVPHSYDFLDVIQVDKTPESYFEFVTLALLGNQYYLHWHGLYHDTLILCDPSDLEVSIKSLDMFEIKMPEDIISRAKEIDITPTIKIEEKTVTIRLVTFSKWGGFSENLYTLEKDNPQNMVDSKFNRLVEYDCGVAF